jgi:hypothetical protein
MTDRLYPIEVWTRKPRALVGMLFVLLLAVGVSDPAQGQLIDRLVVTPTFGVVFPTSDMADYVLPGPTFGMRAMYEFSPRIALGLESAFDSHQGNPESSHTLFTGPPYQMLRYGVAAEVALLPPSPGRLAIVVGGGAGLATMFSEPMYNPEKIPNGQPVGGPGQTEFTYDALRFEGTYPGFNGLLRIAYAYDASTTLFIEGLGFRTNVDQEKTKVFAQGSWPVAKVGADGRTLAFDEGPALVPPSSITTVGARVGFQLKW